MDTVLTKNYAELARKTRREVLTLIYKAKTSHIASNFSVIDIATVLYENLTENDLVVWSKGWAAATIYYFLHKRGKITEEQLKSFPQEPFFGLAETTVPGVLVNGGSVGHGLPIAVGMAYAKKLSNQSGNVYCTLSDGELNEGSVWEAVMLATHLKLNNLIVFIDVNKFQAMGKTSDIVNIELIEDKWMSFGWKVQRINGHDYNEIYEALTIDFTEEKLIDLPAQNSFLSVPLIIEYKDKPMVIICDTIKGKGVSFMENSLLFHYKHIDDEDYKKAMEELA